MQLCMRRWRNCVMSDCRPLKSGIAYSSWQVASCVSHSPSMPSLAPVRCLLLCCYRIGLPQRRLSNRYFIFFIYRVVQKTDPLVNSDKNFGKHGPILTIFSLLQQEIYGAQNLSYFSHLTFIMLLHYLAKQTLMLDQCKFFWIMQKTKYVFQWLKYLFTIVDSSW